MPDLSVGALLAPTASSEESTLKPFCLVLHSPVVLTGLFPGWLRSVLSQLPAGLPCNGCVLHLALCSLGRFSCFSVFSPLVTVRVHHATWWCCSRGNAVCYALWLHVPGFWNVTGVASGEFIVCFSSLYSMVGCPVQLSLFECLRHLVNASPLFFWCADRASHAHSVSHGCHRL